MPNAAEVNKQMEEPRCKKCGGKLNHRTGSDHWICEECGCDHILVKHENEMPPEIQKVRMETRRYTHEIDKAAHNFIWTVGVLENHYGHMGGVSRESDEILARFQEGYKLMCEALQDADRFLQKFGAEMSCTYDGHFEIYEPPQFR